LAATAGVLFVGDNQIVSGPNPTTSSYNASVVNFYNATSSLVRFEIKNIFFFFQKRSNLTTTLAL
jgi:hypothetical protein